MAQRLLGRAEAFSIRPEKIALLANGQDPGNETCTAEGEVAEVQYLGPTTRYLVALEGGGLITVIRQNARGAAGPDAAAGQRVRLAWDRSDIQLLGGGSAP